MSIALEQTDFVVQYPLQKIFTPRTVAVIGASERQGSLGRNALLNLVSNSFGGTVYPVNIKRQSVLGIHAYRSIKDIPVKIDLALIATPANTTPQIIEECLQADVKGAVIISAGYKESGETGEILENRIKNLISGTKIRVIGPNSLGIISPVFGLNASAAQAMPLKGHVGFASQSAAICSAVLDWGNAENVGFSHFISVGSMLDLGWGDLIDYLGNDPDTKSIVIYMETLEDPASFLSAAREVAFNKPIIVMKAGRNPASARAAATHTGRMAGNDEVLDAAFRRIGVLRVNSLAELFYMAEALSKQPSPRGPRLTIVTNTGGLGVIATDALVNDGGELAELPAPTMQKLNEILPPTWSHNNPVDITSSSTPATFTNAVEIALQNPDSDGVLAILVPQLVTDPVDTARQLSRLAAGSHKTILASWVGGEKVLEGGHLLTKNGIPTFPYPDIAVRVFNYMWRYGYNLRSLYETPIPSPETLEEAAEKSQVRLLIDKARKEGRTHLTEIESKQILEAYSIPVVEARLAKTADEAVQLAADIGYPVVLKLHSRTIDSKKETGGVCLNLHRADKVRQAFNEMRYAVTSTKGPEAFQGVTVQKMIEAEGYELIFGSTADPQFGPVILFGRGGRMVESYHDRAVGLPPLNTTLAIRLMESTHIFSVLKEKGYDMEHLAKLLVNFSQLIVEQPFIKEIDVNPLLIGNDSLITLDARMVLYEADILEEKLTRPAIRPYPNQYKKYATLKEGTQVTIRPIRPEDEPMMVKFQHTLSERSVFMRYVNTISLNQRTSHEWLSRMCFVDYNREIALIVKYKHPETGESEIIAVCHLTKLGGANDAEFAILISDNWQGHGLGKELMQDMLQIGRDEKFRKIIGFIHPDNAEMLRVCKKLGFKQYYSFEEGLNKVELDLNQHHAF